jgi:hypothetical protein
VVKAQLLSNLKRTESVTRQYREAFVNNIICLLIMTYKKFGEKELMLILKCSLQIICRKTHHKADFPHQTPTIHLSHTQQAGRPLQHTEKQKNVPIEK